MPPGRALAAGDEPAGIGTPDADAAAAALADAAGLVDTATEARAEADAAALAGLLAGLLAGAADPPQAASSMLAPVPATAPPATRMNLRRLTVSAVSLDMKVELLYR